VTKLLTIFLTMLVALLPARSASLADRLTPEAAATNALVENLELTAARFAIAQAQGRLQQAGLWPNPDWEMSRSREASLDLNGESKFSTGFRQRFPITGRLDKAKAVARVDVAMAMAEVRNQERLLIGEVLLRSRELIAVREQLKANEDIQGVIRKLIEVSERRLKVAEVSVADVNLAKLELQKAQLAKAELLTQQETTTVELNRLLARAPDQPLEIVGTIETSLDPARLSPATQQALSNRPDHQLAALAVNRADAEIKLARAQKWEDWTVGFDYSRDRSIFEAPVGTKVDNFIGLSISIPLPLWNKNQGRVSEAQAAEQRARAELSALELRIRAEVQSAENRVRRRLAILGQYRTESLKLAEDNLALLQRGYADGLVSVTAVIQAQQQLTELRQASLEAVVQLARVLTEWETATAARLSPASQKSPETKP
jgi:outer membrane protein, heavy metal efflux system